MPNIGEVITSPTTGRKARWDGKGYVLITDAAGMENLGDGYKRAPTGQTFRVGNSGSMTRVAGPSDTQLSDAAKGASGVSAALSRLDAFDKQFRKTKTVGPLGQFLNPDDMAVLQQSARDLQMALKEKPYNLGVLNGPDLMLLNQILEDPSSIKTAMFRSRIRPMLSNLARILGDTYRQDAAAFKATGGNPGVLPKLYQAPDSRYTPQQWGNQGLVPRNALDPSSTPPQTRKAAQPKSTKAMTDDDIKAALGL